MKPDIEVLKREELAILKMRSLYEHYGYKKYKMSRFEEYSFYMENKSFLASQNIATFTDLDGKLLALKPDVTLSIIKNTKGSATNTEKLYYIENVYRPSAAGHNYKEINQVGLECIGTIDDYAQIEMVELALKSLDTIGPDYMLTVSHMGFIKGLLKSLAIEEKVQAELLRFMRAKNQHELKTAAKQAGLSEKDIVLLSKVTALSGKFAAALKDAEKLVQNDEMAAALAELKKLYSAAKAFGTASKLWLDFSVISNMEYYNGLLFSGYLEGLPRAVLSGGRYDSMMTKMGKNASAIGFAIYLDDLSLLPKENNDYDVDAIVLYDEQDDVIALAKAIKKLGRSGIKIQTARTLPNDLKYRTVYRYNNGALEEEKC